MRGRRAFDPGDSWIRGLSLPELNRQCPEGRMATRSAGSTGAQPRTQATAAPAMPRAAGTPAGRPRARQYAPANRMRGSSRVGSVVIGGWYAVRRSATLRSVTLPRSGSQNDVRPGAQKVPDNDRGGGQNVGTSRGWRPVNRFRSIHLSALGRPGRWGRMARLVALGAGVGAAGSGSPGRLHQHRQDSSSLAAPAQSARASTTPAVPPTQGSGPRPVRPLMSSARVTTTTKPPPP